MTMTASRHETGVKTFLGTTIPAGTSGEDSLRLALDTLFAHPNLAPNISRQLILRLVTSNPSPAYVGAGGGRVQRRRQRRQGQSESRGQGDPAGRRSAQRQPRRDPASASSANPSCAWPPGRAPPAPPRRRTPGRSAIPRTRPPAWRKVRCARAACSIFSGPAMCRPTAPSAAPAWSRRNSRSPMSPAWSATSTTCRAWSTTAPATSSPPTAALLPMADTAPALVDELNVVLAAGQLSAPRWP